MVFAASGAFAAQAPVAYRLTPVVDHGALSALSVEMRFAGDADGVTDLELPSQWAEGEKLWRLVSGLRVEGAQLDPGGDRWRAIGHGHGKERRLRHRGDDQCGPDQGPPLPGP